MAPRWRARPVLAGAIRTAAFVVPLGGSIVTGILVGTVLPTAHTWLLAALAWAVVIVTSTVALFLIDRITRRLLPVATLLKLSMLFPDRAPSRYKIARQSAGTRALAEELRNARQGGAVSGNRQQAAETILALVGALGDYDSRTRGHSERTQLFVAMIAEELKLKPGDRDRLLWAALIHDIGKLNVPETVLNKPGKPTASEWEQLRRHPIDGSAIVAPLSEWLGTWSLAVEHHHERYDGTGYPHGLAGDRISLAGRIVAVADSYEVMTAARSYKKPMTAAEARAELARCASSQFDPAVVKAFLAISLSRVRWIAGPLSWLAQVPFLQSIPLAGQAVAAGTSVLATGATVVGLGLGPSAAAASDPYNPQGHRTQAGQPATATPGQTSTNGAGSSGTANAPRGGTHPTSTSSTATSRSTDPTSSSSTSSDSTPSPVSSTSSGSPGPGRSTSSSSSSSSHTSTTPPPPANKAPVAQADGYTVKKDSPAATFDVLANDSDPDGDPLRIVSTSTPQHGTVSFTASKVTYKPTSKFVGTDTFTYRIADDAGHADTATVTIRVLKDNHPPATKDDTYTVHIGQTMTGHVLSNDTDPDGDSLTVTKDDSALITVASDGSFTFTGLLLGKMTFHYTASDGLATHKSSVTIKVIL